MPLGVNRDATYDDSATDPSQKLHQQDHDALHALYNDFEGTTPADFATAADIAALDTRLDTIEGDNATQTELDAHVNDTADAHDASAISFTPTGTIASTNVQDAIAEAASEGGGGGASTGVVIAAHSYEAGTDGNIVTTSSATLVDIDATNAAISFTAPSTGSVLVEASVYAGNLTAGADYILGLRESGSTIPGTDMRMLKNASTTNANTGRQHYMAVVTGLTASSAHTYTLGIAANGGTGSALAYSGPGFGPIVIKVTSLP